MTRTSQHWILPIPVPEAVQEQLASFSAPFQSILYRRGCKTESDAISLLLPEKPAYPEELQLGHVDLASQLIANAQEKGLMIAVFGDYDTDGITATALLTLALNKIGCRVIPFIPDRLKDGYGLNIPAIDSLREQGADLLITVDNGIRSLLEIAHAKAIGLDVIITDHHLPGEILPQADAIINPKVPGDPYPNKNLAGVGVAYKLISSLSSYYPGLRPDDYLDLVALGTIADIVPLTGENRYLVKQGLNSINQHIRQSLFSLVRMAGLEEKKVLASDISFQIAPRINSSGRVHKADHLIPLRLLLSEDPAKCGEYAQNLEIHNDRRKLSSTALRQRVESRFSSLEQLPSILIALDPDTELGVAGIAAGYLTRKYYLPAIVGNAGDYFTIASCRSIPEFNIVHALEKVGDLFTHFGGHKLAAGFTLPTDKIPEFRERITALADSELSSQSLRPILEIDASVSLSELNRSLHRELLKLEPTGEKNPKPVFSTSSLSALQVDTVGGHEEHLKLTVSDGSQSIAAIAFGFGEFKKDMPGKFDLAYHFTENEFRGRKEFQLQVLDIKPS